MAITNFVSRCLHGEPLVVYGSGEQTRDFTYIEDIRRVNEQLLDDDSADGDNADTTAESEAAGENEAAAPASQ
jgi:nucleoside-diphosphate-sugar epimerase